MRLLGPPRAPRARPRPVRPGTAFGIAAATALLLIALAALVREQRRTAWCTDAGGWYDHEAEPEHCDPLPADQGGAAGRFVTRHGAVLAGATVAGTYVLGVAAWLTRGRRRAARPVQR